MGSKPLIFGGEWKGENRSLSIGIGKKLVDELAASICETARSSEKTLESSRRA
jgi:hypothetical protein